MAKNIQIVYTVNDAALLKAQKALEANEAAAKKSTDQVNKFGKQAAQAGSDASKSFLNLGTVWKSLIAIGLISFVTNLGKKILDLGIKQEQLNIAFTTFLGSAEKAKKLLQDLNKFALVTPFTPDQVNKAAQALLAFGVKGQEIIPTLKMLGDVSSGTGKDLTEMAIIFGQIRSTGRLMGQDLLQLINAGFNPLQVISEKTGKSVKILKQEMEKGLITFDMVSGAFKTATTEGGLFFNLMEKQSQSIGGVLSTIEGNFDELLKNLFAAETGPMKRFVDLLERFSRGLLLFSLTEDQVIEKGNQMVRDEFTVKFNEFAKTFTTIDEAAKVMNESLDQTIARLDAEHRAALTATDINIEETERLRAQIEVKKQQKIAIDDVLKARDDEAKQAQSKTLQTKLEEEAKAAKELTGRLKDLEKELSKIQEKPIEEEGALEKGLGGFEETLAKLEVFGDNIAAELQTQSDEQLRLKHDADVAEIKAEDDKQKQIAALKRQAFDYTLSLLGQFLMANANAGDETFKREKGDFDRRLKLAGNNERARQEIENEREAFEQAQDARAQEFATEQARKDKERQIKQMIIQGVLNSIRALGNPPVPNFAAAGITAAATLASLAIAKGIGFKEGGINIQGPGTGKSDSISARISKGESVITAEATARSLNLLTAINERKIDDRILNKLKVSQSGVTVINDNKELIDAFERGQVDHYEEGHFTYKQVKKGETLTRHLKGKYFS